MNSIKGKFRYTERNPVEIERDEDVDKHVDEGIDKDKDEGIDEGGDKHVDKGADKDNKNMLIESRLSPLTEEQKERAREAFKGNDNERIRGNIIKKDIKTLKPGTWLNDEIINTYMDMLNERDTLLSSKFPDRKASHFFKTYIMSNLGTGEKYSFERVQKYESKINIFELRRLYFPINIKDTHWTLAVVDMDAKQIHYYDSMNKGGHIYMNSLLMWLKDKAEKSNSGNAYDMSEWKCLDEENIPQQINGFDCGMFLISYCDFLSDNLPLSSFSQEDMPDFRLKTVLKILNNKLDYPLVLSQ